MGVQRYHAELTKLDSSGNQYMIYPKTTVVDVYTDSKSGINIEGKLNFFGLCTTSGDTALKTVTIPGFVLKTGSKLEVMLMHKPTTSSIISLRVNDYASYEIYYKGANINPDILYDKVVISLVFFNNRFEVVGIDSVMSVSELTSSNIYLTATSGTGVQRELHMNKNVYIQGGTGKIVASGFIGDGSTLTKLNASNIGSGTLSVNRLSDSGVEAKTYGPTGDSSVAIGNSISVPSFTVDAKGRITSAASRSISLALDKTYLPLSGGTLTGNLVVKPSTGSGTIQLCYNGNTAGEISTVSNGLSIYPIYTNCGYVGTYNQQFKAMYATTFYGSLSGNATSATKLETSRTLTIGNTGKSFNGSGNVSWSLTEIGASPASHEHEGIYGYYWAANYELSLCFDGSDSLIPSPSSKISLGNSSNVFNSIYVVNVYENGTKLSDKYAPISHTHTSLVNGTYGLSISSTGDLIPSGTGSIWIGNSNNRIPAIYATNMNATTMTGTTIYENGKLLSKKYVPINTTYTEIVSEPTVVAIRGSGLGYSTGGVKVTVYSTGDGSIADTYAEFTATTDNACNLGQYHTRWKNVYAASGTVSTSDKNLKNNIKELSEKYKKLLLAITPSTFVFKDGTSGRTHTGFISQDVEEKMTLCGLTDMDFAGFCKDQVTEEHVNEDGTISRIPVYDENGDPKYIYSLRYMEFVPIIASMVQDLHKEIEKLKECISQ